MVSSRIGLRCGGLLHLIIRFSFFFLLEKLFFLRKEADIYPAPLLLLRQSSGRYSLRIEMMSLLFKFIAFIVAGEKESRYDKQQEGQQVKEDISWKQTAAVAAGWPRFLFFSPSLMLFSFFYKRLTGAPGLSSRKPRAAALTHPTQYRGITSLSLPRHCYSGPSNT